MLLAKIPEASTFLQATNNTGHCRPILLPSGRSGKQLQQSFVPMCILPNGRTLPTKTATAAEEKHGRMSDHYTFVFVYFLIRHRDISLAAV